MQSFRALNAIKFYFHFQMSQGQRIKELRAGEQKNTFAAKVGVTPTNISAIEKDKQPISMNIAMKLHEIYDCSLDWLILGIGPKSVNIAHQQNETKKSIRTTNLQQVGGGTYQVGSDEEVISRQHHDEVVSAKNELIEILKNQLSDCQERLRRSAQ